MPNNQPAFRIFVCVKTRQDGRPACGNAGAAEIMAALRVEFVRRGQPAAHIDVRPCGCLDRCDQGPVLVGFSGAIAEAAVPSRKLMENLMRCPEVCFERVSIDHVPAIVDQILGVRK